MLYLDNPGKGKGKRMAKRKTKTKRTTRKRPTAKQIAARKKFAAMARARAKASRKTKRATTTKGVGMAKRKRTTTKRRRSSKRRSVVRHARRSVYRANPRRAGRRRRGGYRRNPGMVRELFSLVKRSGTVLGGGIVGRVVTDMLPSVAPAGQAESPFVQAAKGTLVAFGVRMLAKRFLGAEVATDLAIGAMQVPLKALVVGLAPAANQAKVASFLGDYSLGAYSVPVGVLEDGTEIHEMTNAGVSSYADIY